MLHLIIFTPLLAALLIVIGAPARKTALLASVFTLALAVRAFLLFDESNRDTFMYVSSWAILPEIGRAHV